MNLWKFFFFLCNVAILILIFLQLLFSIKVRTSVTTAQYQYFIYIDSDYIIEKYKITFISVICIFIFGMLLFISHFTLYCAYTNRSIRNFKIFFIVHGFLTFFDILTIVIFLSTAEEYKDFLKNENVILYFTDIKDEFWKAYYYDMITILIILIWEIILMFVLAKDKKIYGLKPSNLIRKLLQD